MNKSEALDLIIEHQKAIEKAHELGFQSAIKKVEEFDCKECYFIEECCMNSAYNGKPQIIYCPIHRSIEKLKRGSVNEG